MPPSSGKTIATRSRQHLVPTLTETRRPTPTRDDRNKKITDYAKRETRTTRREENSDRIPGGVAEWANDIPETSENEEEGYEETADGEEKEDGELTLQRLGLISAGNRITTGTLADVLNSLAEANIEDDKGKARLRSALRSSARLLASISMGEARPSEGKELEDSIIGKLKATITDTVNIAMGRISKDIEEATKAMRSVNTATMELTTKTQSYSEAVRANPALLDVPFALNTAIDPRVRAREAIRKRQVLIDIEQSEENRALIQNTSITGFTEEFNRRFKEIGGYNDYEVKALTKLANGGLLLEMSSEEGAKWVKSREKEIEEVVGAGAKVKKRTYPVIIKFVPITLDPESEEERATIEDANDLTRGTLSSLRWIKPVAERSKGQRVGHLIARFESEEDANKVTAMGLYIHHVRVIAEKQGREPTRCYRCQDYGHIAAHCAKDERCARCGGAHSSKGCLEQPRCIPCGLKGHPSYSRNCAVFHRKCAEMDTRLPENKMPYYPTGERWTHWGAPERTTPFGQQQTSQAPRPSSQPSQSLRRDATPPTAPRPFPTI